MSPACRNRWLAAVATGSLFAIPLAVFRVKTGPLAFYLGDGFPPGQAAYILMRPAGHLAFNLLFLQIVLGLNQATLARWLNLPPLLPLHKALALPTLSLALLHPLLFAWARVLRLETPFATSLKEVFLPDPTVSYWSFYFHFGAMALFALILAILAALLGPRFLPRGWKLIHGLNYAAFGLAWFHCRATGNEVREQPLEVVYTLMTAGVAAMLAHRLAGHVRPPAAPAPAGRPAGRAGV